MQRRLFAIGLVLALGSAGCGGDEEHVATAPPSAEQAVAHLADARRDVDALRAKVAASKQAQEASAAAKEKADAAAEQAAEAYDQARNALRDAEQKLASLEPPPPSDAEVFRRVQKQLLDSPALARVAIQAEVNERTVTLHGSVPDAATRDAAVAVANGVDGVKSVESSIEIVD
jgi:hyperosmotically inducible periplasmic protein